MRINVYRRSVEIQADFPFDAQNNRIVIGNYVEPTCVIELHDVNGNGLACTIEELRALLQLKAVPQ